MNKSNFNRKLRKTHRWLGLIIGIQFILWTFGGLYFSWSDMDEIHGDHQKAHIHPLSSETKLTNPQDIVEKIKARDTIYFIHDVHLIQILNKPVYQIIYSKEHDRNKKTQLANANNGELRPPLSKNEAIEVAKASFSGNLPIKQVEYLKNTDGHHEYREQALPAWAITFAHPTNTTVYVSSELGTVQKFRNNKWRVFDFLWMMHTMDYKSRDNISNWLLRAFSILGLLTISTGFILFFVNLKTKEKTK
jgi:hypothetical protein